MNEPWGIAGPDFLRIYLVVSAFAMLFALAVRIMVRAGSADARSASATVRPGQLTIHELAYLAGGNRRVVETAVARLIDRDKVRPSRSGTVRAVEGAAVTDPIDRVVLTDIQRYGDRSIGLLVDKVGWDSAVRKLGETLVSKGLLVGEAAARARWGVLPLAVLFAVGAARWANGLSDGRPVGWLTLALIGTALVAVLIYRRPVPERTYAGEKVLAEARSERSTAQSMDTGLLVGAVGVVALSGLVEHPDAHVAAAMEAQRHSTTGNGYGGCSTGSTFACGGGSSSCSSGGGGGCGGGGCGG